MYVVMITPECAPVAKVGGLGDVVQGLSYEESIRGNTVEVILPKYDCMRYDRILGLTRVYDGLWVLGFIVGCNSCRAVFRRTPRASFFMAGATGLRILVHARFAAFGIART